MHSSPRHGRCSGRQLPQAARSSAPSAQYLEAQSLTLILPLHKIHNLHPSTEPAMPPPESVEELHASVSDRPIRPARKAAQGWYEEDLERLNDGYDERQRDGTVVHRNGLNDWLKMVPKTIEGSSLPIPGARMIIGPHAGYFFAGKTAAWAYSVLDLQNVKRVFVLGPSHTYGLTGCAVSNFSAYATPFGNLVVDEDTVESVRKEADLDYMDHRGEKNEHSLEMHMPYLYKMCEKAFNSPDEFPTIVPILVGNNSMSESKRMAQVLLPYLRDPENAFIISSDFCHWGDRFDYMPYLPTRDIDHIEELSVGSKAPVGSPIHESIRILDEAAMEAVESGSHEAFVNVLRKTGNTVCGRYPIGVAMAALELYSEDVEDDEKAKFKVIYYARSEEKLVDPRGSSVSYVSAYAVL
ncbi:memo-like protein-domain-containing protein [Stachybotrys elegans]|uniref:Memo-like protein-domain-containing protein n=1 Tax=Stachybotrys elegans TaxID=80388 RepID=A0A8K0SYY4_9HYPO|nr:memo-like protein-domain-containing protein [Stachybotrys elegans]